jgi:hypothetical protein
MKQMLLGKSAGWMVTCVATSAAMLAAGGCSESEDKPTVRELEGTIESIDDQARAVRVRFYLEKEGVEMTETVHVTDETEIFINGALARFGDVKEGERAKGTVRIEKQDGGQRLVTALRVHIKRAEVIKATDTPKPPAE